MLDPNPLEVKQRGRNLGSKFIRGLPKARSKRCSSRRRRKRTAVVVLDLSSLPDFLS